jgi:hypothetical protein
MSSFASQTYPKESAPRGKPLEFCRATLSAFLFARKETLAKKRAKGQTDENLPPQIFKRFPLWNPLSI